MTIALAGIIIIQFRWIARTLAENEKMVNHQVVQAISNVDTQLSDFSALSYFISSENPIEGMINQEIIIENGDTLVHEINHQPDERTEVRVLTNHSDSFINEHEQVHVIEHHTSHDSAKIEVIAIEQEWHQNEEVQNVFERIKLEVHSSSGDVRLDSSKIEGLLDNELRAFEIYSPKVWGVYDRESETYVIDPSKKLTFEYQIPLFKNDIIYPRRYEVHLSLLDKDTLVWKDIWYMIFLSIIFILIILSVFIFSIRLIIKHKKISQIKSDFINNMTHEFKTPLASISLAADSIVHEEVIRDPSKIEKYIQLIQEEKHKLNEQIERILEVAALDKKALQLREETVNIKTLIEQSVEKMRLILEKNDAEIELNIASLANIKASPLHLSNVLVNILDNSVKYAQGTPKISISTNQVDAYVQIEIKDQGIGLTREQLNRVFDNFYRAQSGNLHDTKGFGLGLSYAKLIVEYFHGSISISSVKNEGTTVLIKLPVYE